LQSTIHLSTPKGRKAWLADLQWNSGRFTHISGHPSAAGRAQDRESSLVKDQRSTTAARNQPSLCLNDWRQRILAFSP